MSSSKTHKQDQPRPTEDATAQSVFYDQLEGLEICVGVFVENAYTAGRCATESFNACNWDDAQQMALQIELALSPLLIFRGDEPVWRDREAMSNSAMRVEEKVNALTPPLDAFARDVLLQQQRLLAAARRKDAAEGVRLSNELVTMCLHFAEAAQGVANLHKAKNPVLVKESPGLLAILRKLWVAREKPVAASPQRSAQSAVLAQGLPPLANDELDTIGSICEPLAELLSKHFVMMIAAANDCTSERLPVCAKSLEKWDRDLREFLDAATTRPQLFKAGSAPAPDASVDDHIAALNVLVGRYIVEMRRVVLSAAADCRAGIDVGVALKLREMRLLHDRLITQVGHDENLALPESPALPRLPRNWSDAPADVARMQSDLCVFNGEKKSTAVARTNGAAPPGVIMSAPDRAAQGVASEQFANMNVSDTAQQRSRSALRLSGGSVLGVVGLFGLISMLTIGPDEVTKWSAEHLQLVTLFYVLLMVVGVLIARFGGSASETRHKR